MSDRLSESMRKDVLRQADYQCEFCGIDNDIHKERFNRSLEVHHIIPRRVGGMDRMMNLVALCRPCHDNIGVLQTKAFAVLKHQLDGIDYLDAQTLANEVLDELNGEITVTIETEDQIDMAEKDIRRIVRDEMEQAMSSRRRQ